MDRRNLVIWIFIACFVLFVLFVWGRSNGLVFGGMFGGRVVEDETQQPMAGAYVIALWDTRTFGQGHCVHMDIETTDENGEYFFPPWVDLVKHTVFSQDPPVLLAYASGYEQVSYQSPIRLKRHDDSPRERIEEVNRVSSQFCGSGPSNLKSEKARVREKMYMEAKQLLEEISDDPEGKYAYRVEFLKRKCGERCQ